MDEQNIPIDINNNKLLEWLISRRHVNKDWQSSVIRVREKINGAIQDMPAHQDIIKLLTGQHINYFHCLKIIDILKETEADTKNLFGRYGSQRMKDWQDIVSSYQKDNIYLAEASQILIRNVSYEIPSLRKQVAKLEQAQQEAQKKIKDYTKNESAARKEFAAACEQLGIDGDAANMRAELKRLVGELPDIYASVADKIKLIRPALELYGEFHRFHLSSKKDEEVLPLLKFVIEHGNTTTYEYTYGEKPIAVEVPDEPALKEAGDYEDDPQIDFGESEIDFGDITVEEESGGDIDWGTNTTEEGFEIVEHVDLTLEESGIVVEKSGLDGGVARGTEALSLLDNPKTRDQITNELVELHSFLKMRLHEMSNESDSVLDVFQMQDATVSLQMQTVESVTSLNDTVSVALGELTNKRAQHLHNIKHSPKYLDNLTASLKQKLVLIDRIRQSKHVLEEQINCHRKEVRSINPSIKLLIDKTKQLQKEVQEEISKKYKGRTVNIVGGINML